MYIVHKWLVAVGVEVASAKTQTSKLEDVSSHSAGFSAPPTQFVVGMFIVTAFHSILYGTETVNTAKENCSIFSLIRIC